MKKLLFISILGLLMVGCSNDSTNESSKSNSSMMSRWPDSGSVTVTWSLGRKSRECHGFGICRHEHTTVTIDPITINLDSLQLRQCIYGHTIKLDDNQLLVTLDSPSRRYANQYFGGDNIIFDEDTQFDFSDLNIGLRDFNVRSGKYPIQYDEDSKQYGFILINKP